MSSALKIVVVGEGAVGKSSLTIRYVQGTFVTEYDPTIESSYRRVATVEGEPPVMLDILDTAGQEEYACIRDSYLRVGQGFMLVFSCTSKASLGWCQEMHTKILQIKDVDEFPILLIGNKADIKDMRQVSTADAQQIAASMKLPYYETSAKTGQNVEEVFTAAAKLTLSYIRKRGRADDPDEALRTTQKSSVFGCILI